LVITHRTLTLNVTGELAQKHDQGMALFLFVGSGMDAVRRLGRKGGSESCKCCLHVCEIDRRVWIVFVSGHARDDGPYCFLDLVIALPREFQKNTDVFCSHDASSFYLTVDVL